MVAEALGVSKSFGRGAEAVQALRGVDLRVASGELLMLVGPSGCGKTTLISALAGILNYDAGTIKVLGQDLAQLSTDGKAQFRGRNLGFVFQSFNLLPSLTACENAAVPLIIIGEPRATALKKAAELLARVGLGDRLHAMPTQLSGGQQQRVAIARALVHDPHLVVCDEPTSALDHHTGQSVMALLREVAVRPGRALLVVTHDARIFPYADRIATMDDGHITAITAQQATTIPGKTDLNPDAQSISKPSSEDHP